ncbi:hypothetical protein J4526_07690 [Desulfurococcaceae archaeon MEX13E-LK6-19]|nr:hypothetical protein J4526_07690 [Desulfurococcaceae archaeon MEX13E-LK6-19]
MYSSEDRYLPLMVLSLVIALGLLSFLVYLAGRPSEPSVPPSFEPPGWEPGPPDCGKAGYVELVNSTKRIRVKEEGSEPLWLVRVRRNDSFVIYFRVVVNESFALCFFKTTNYTLKVFLNSIGVNGTREMISGYYEGYKTNYSFNGIHIVLNNVSDHIYVLKVYTYNAVKGRYVVEVLADIYWQRASATIGFELVMEVV